MDELPAPMHELVNASPQELFSHRQKTAILPLHLSKHKHSLHRLREERDPEEIAVASSAVANAQEALINAIQSAYTSSDDAIHNKADSFFTTPRTDPKLSFTIANFTLKTTVEQERAAIDATFASWKLLVSSLSNANVADVAKQAQLYLKQVVTFLVDANTALNQGIADQNISALTLASYVSTLATGRTNVNNAVSAISADMATRESAEKNLTLLRAGSTPENIAAQQAAVAAAQASLAKTRVIAPFGGTVTRMDAKVGRLSHRPTHLFRCRVMVSSSSRPLCPKSLSRVLQ